MRWNKNPIPLHAVVGGAGKTCASHLIRNVLEAGLGQKYGLITTRHAYLGSEVLPPPAWPDWRGQLDQELERMGQAGCDAVVLTLPLFALGSEALAGLAFETVVLTGCGDTAEADEVAQFLKTQEGWWVCNIDDPYLRKMVQGRQQKTVTYAERRSEADLNARNLRLCSDRIEFEALTDEAICRMRLPIPGGFGLYNALAALACGLRSGLTLEQMARILPNTRGVRGRMELLPLAAPFGVLIDSAATPEQVDNLLMAARGLAEGRLILVLGAPGDRDRSRRPMLGEAASRADVVILTADDPRTESVEDICRQIRSGMEEKHPEVILERRMAIERALDLAQPSDLVLLSGRGDKTQMLTREGAVDLEERAVVFDYFRRGKVRKRKDTWSRIRRSKR